MAIGYGLTGKIRGKLGAQVYRIEAGKQIISEYNPEKQDAKSEKQLIQRSKMDIATKVSRVFPWETIVGMSYNRSKARSLFVGSLAKIATTTESEGEIIGMIDMEKVQLSKGVPVRVDSKFISVLSEVGEQYVNARVAFGLDSAVKRFLFVPVVENPTTHELFSAGYALSNEISTHGACAITYNIADVFVVSGIKIHGYAVPIMPNTLKKRVVYGNIVLDANEYKVTAETLVAFARADLFASSVFIGTTTIA